MPTTRISGPALLCALLAAACGGAGTAPAPGVSTTRVALVSTVPNPGGGLDRWADLHFTFSAPVDWAETQFVQCVSGCRANLVPYRFVSTGTEVVGTPILPPEFGASYSMRVTPLLAQAAANGDTAANIDFAWSTLPPTTTIASDVTTDATLTLAGSPYCFAPGVHIAAALTIAAGVEVAGDLVATGTGSVTAIGTSASRIRISNAVYSAPGRLSYVDMLGAISVSAQDVDHVDIEAAKADRAGRAINIAGSLTDSRIVGMPVSTLAGDTERNLFLSATVQLGGDFGIIHGANDAVATTRWTASTRFVNNYVDTRAVGAYSSVGAVLSVQANSGTIRGNTFLGLSGGNHGFPAIETEPPDLAGNWWGTSDAAACAAYFAVAYTGAAASVIAPVLSAPDPATPTP